MVRAATTTWRRSTSAVVFNRGISINNRSIPSSAASAPTTQSSDANDESEILNKTIANPESIGQVAQLKSYQTLETAKFESLGTPPTLLSIHSPPSVPIYLRRGSLLSIYGLRSSTGENNSSNSNSSLDVDDGPIIRNTVEFPHWWKRFILTGKIQAFQKLISTIPISLLISSKNKSNSNQPSDPSFVSLILDGSNDWAILNKNAVQVYTGNSLSVSIHSLPRYISKKLAKQLNKSGGGAAGSSSGGVFRVGLRWFGKSGGSTTTATGGSTARAETGLRTLWNRGYTLLSGRGQVGVVGNGGVYQLDVGDQEEILINKRAILAITVNGPFDLENCVLRDMSSVSLQQKSPVTAAAAAAATPTTTSSSANAPSSLLSFSFSNLVSKVKPNTQVVADTATAPPATTKTTPPSTATLTYYQLKHYWFRFVQLTKSLVSHTRHTYHRLHARWENYTLGTSDFVKIVGPRNVLIQSSFNVRKQSKKEAGQRASPLMSSPSNGFSDSNVTPTTTTTPQDYLSYVTIDPEQGAVFKSTPNFKQTVDEIEQRNGNKK
ncbi:AIM24 [Candida theae]|uniref:Altered inheritance of mitochondria protein 24, mitochondrial n=1 Tax=Candida theae TaxID=1198502 RepID=A0AAD5BBC6_9ASCO|nr:AIM24 [Candida theae]KAI5950073.1 AIM24 [Candida theae]